MIVIIIVLILVGIFWFFRDSLYSLLSFISLRLEGRVPDFQILNSLRDDLIHERKKKIASLEMILSTWEKGESISTHLDYFRDLISQLKLILKDQRENLLMISSDPFLWVRLKSQVIRIERDLQKIEKDKQKIKEIKKRLSIFSDEIEEILEKATQKFTFTLNEVIKESVKIVRTEKDRVLKEKRVIIEEKYEDIGERLRLSYKNYKDWQKLITNLIRNGVEAVEQKLQANSPSPLATGYSLPAGVVRVLVRGEGDDVAVVMEDNGIGMDEKTKETFYKRGFTQGKEAGLGLGITEETVEFINKYGSWNIESKINEGTRIEIKIEKDKARKQDLTIEDKSALVIKLKSRKMMFALEGILVVAIGLGLYFQFNKYARFWEDWNINHFEVKGKILKVLNKRNEILWTKEFYSPIGGSVDWMPSPIIEDINRDGHKEIIFPLAPTDTSSGRILCMDFKGRELWNFYCGRKSIYDVEQDVFTPNIILLKDLDGDGNIEVIINNRVAVNFSDYLVILDSKGREKSEYWHPGLIGVLHCEDINGDGKIELVCGGVNNRMDWRACFFALDLHNVCGQAMPYCGNKNVPNAREVVYILFPHAKKNVGQKFSWEYYYDWVYQIHFFLEKNEITTYRFVTARQVITWYLDRNFNVKNIAYNLGDINQRYSEMKFPYKITQKDIDNLWNIEVWKKGVRIR